MVGAQIFRSDESGQDCLDKVWFNDDVKFSSEEGNLLLLG